MGSLAKIVAVASESDLKRLKELYDHVEAQIRAFQVLGVERESYAAALVNLSGEKAVNCAYCRQGHLSAWYTTITDIRARKNLLKQQGRCFIYLPCNHPVQNCPSSSTYHNCSGTHNF